MLTNLDFVYISFCNKWNMIETITTCLAVTYILIDLYRTYVNLIPLMAIKNKINENIARL